MRVSLSEKNSYGGLGFEAIYNQLQTSLVKSAMVADHLVRPLDVDSYVRRVLVPEAAVCLIQTDQSCERSQAIAILEESRAYGLAVHSVQDELGEIQEERDEKEELARKREKKAQKKAKEARAMEIL